MKMDEANGAADQGGDAGRISDGRAWLNSSKHRFAEPYLILLTRTARHHLGGNKLGAAPIAWSLVRRSGT